MTKHEVRGRHQPKAENPKAEKLKTEKLKPFQRFSVSDFSHLEFV
jgi:hypothetical protein